MRKILSKTEVNSNLVPTPANEMLHPQSKKALYQNILIYNHISSCSGTGGRGGSWERGNEGAGREGKGKRERERGLSRFRQQLWNMQSVNRHALFPDSRQPSMYKQDSEKGRRIGTRSLIKLKIQ